MSNHSGSYMLNEILKMLEKESIFEYLGKEKTQKIVFDIINMSYQYDCNPGEILEDIGERVGICYYCKRPADEFCDGVCKKCYEKDNTELEKL
jgi:recombinational DNA repair protein RecR